jgi:hypothetical protein
MVLVVLRLCVGAGQRLDNEQRSRAGVSDLAKAPQQGRGAHVREHVVVGLDERVVRGSQLDAQLVGELVGAGVKVIRAPSVAARCARRRSWWCARGP